MNHERELTPGVNLDVSHTDISHQRFDGWVGRGLQQPLVFYNQGDDRPHELVITRVTKYSVVGYVLEPKENGPLTARR